MQQLQLHYPNLVYLQSLEHLTPWPLFIYYLQGTAGDRWQLMKWNTFRWGWHLAVVHVWNSKVLDEQNFFAVPDSLFTTFRTVFLAYSEVDQSNTMGVSGIPAAKALIFWTSVFCSSAQENPRNPQYMTWNKLLYNLKCTYFLLLHWMCWVTWAIAINSSWCLWTCLLLHSVSMRITLIN